MTHRPIALALMLLALAGPLSACTSMPRGHKPKISTTPYYLSPEAMASFHLPPPAPIGSAPEIEDREAIKAAQRARTKADCERAESEADNPTDIPSYPETFGDIGPFPVPLTGEAREFVIRVWSDASLVSENFKRKYDRPRPFAVDPSIEPCFGRTTNPAYPSGHTLMARVFALVLSDIDPARRSVFMQRAELIARDRVVAGLHRPSELTAGRMLADQIYAKLLESKRFRDELEKVKAFRRLVKDSLPARSSSPRRGYCLATT